MSTVWIRVDSLSSARKLKALWLVHHFCGTSYKLPSMVGVSRIPATHVFKLFIEANNIPVTHHLGLYVAIWFCHFSKSEVFIISSVINFYMLLGACSDHLWLVNTTYFLNEDKSH